MKRTRHSPSTPGAGLRPLEALALVRWLDRMADAIWAQHLPDIEALAEQQHQRHLTPEPSTRSPSRRGVTTKADKANDVVPF